MLVVIIPKTQNDSIMKTSTEVATIHHDHGEDRGQSKTLARRVILRLLGRAYGKIPWVMVADEVEVVHRPHHCTVDEETTCSCCSSVQCNQHLTVGTCSTLLDW